MPSGEGAGDRDETVIAPCLSRHGRLTPSGRYRAAVLSAAPGGKRHFLPLGRGSRPAEKAAEVSRRSDTSPPM